MKSDKNYQILDITVDIGEGKQDKIIVHEYDSPSILARNFSNKHNLNRKLEFALTKNITELIKEMHNEQLQLTSVITSRPEILTSPCKNIGEKLYVKGLQHKEQIEINKQLLKMQIENKINSTISFKPAINKKSEKIAKLSQSRSTIDIRHQSHQSSEQEYTFTPRINENSIKIAGNSINRTQRLYEEAKLKKNRLEMLNENARKTEFPFRPMISHIGEYSDPQELVERLFTSKDNYTENLESLRKKYEVTKDPETGQEFFKPNICRTSTALINQNCLRNQEDIWDHLYKTKKKSPEPAQDYPYSPINLDSKAKSEQILLKVKRSRYSEIFQQLSPDINGLIHYKNIDADNIDHMTLKIIMPLLLELEELNQPLNFEEFSDSMDNLLKTLNTAEKDIFFAKQKKNQEEDTEISSKKSLSSSDFANLYQRHVEKKNLSNAKLEIEREKKKKLEIQGCTFKPTTTKYPFSLFK